MRTLQALMSLGCLVVAMAPSTGCRSKQADVASAAPVAKPQLQLFDVTLQHYRGNELLGYGTAQSLSYFQEGPAMEAQNGKFFLPQPSQTGKKAVELTAPRFRSVTSSQQVDAYDGLIVTTPEGLRFFAQRATYDAATKVVDGNDGVRAWTGGQEVTAKACRMNLVDETYVFEGAVQSKISGVKK